MFGWIVLVFGGDLVVTGFKRATLIHCFWFSLLLISGIFELTLSTTDNVPNDSIIDDEDYSMANLLPSFKTLMFWRTDRYDTDTPTIEELPKSDQVVYQINDVTPEKIIHKPASTIAKQTTSMLRDFEPILNNVHTAQNNNNNNNEKNTVKSVMIEKLNVFPLARNRVCHSCNKEFIFQDETEEYRQRIEYIKGQILTKLGLKEPPQLHSQPDIEFINKYMTEYNKRTEQAFTNDYGQHKDFDLIEDVEIAYILPKRRDLKSPMFDLSTVNADNKKVIKSIIVLVKYNLTEHYRTLNKDTIVDSDHIDLTIASVPNLIETKRNGVDDFDLISSVSPASKTTPSTNGENINNSNVHQENNIHDHNMAYSYEYDVTNILNTGHFNLIRIYNENHDIQRSFIKIEMTTNKFTRAKRSVDCTEKVSFCCRQPFYVNFTTIGWNNWILQPPGYNANYCKGKCDLSHARYHHTTVIGKYPVIKLCCSPREMSSISLIYLDIDYNIYQKNLPNMVVESCDCA